MTVRVADTPFSCHLQTDLTQEMIAGTIRPFPSSPQSLFQDESKCKVFVMNISFNSY